MTPTRYFYERESKYTRTDGLEDLCSDLLRTFSLPASSEMPLCRHPNNRYRFLLPANGNESLNHTSLDLDACTQRPTNSRCPLFKVNTGTMPASLIVKPRVQVQAAHSRPRPIYGDISENRRRVASNWPSSLYNVNKTGSVLQRNIEERSSTYCCSATAINVTYSVCEFVALGIQHAMRMCHIVFCDLSGSTIFFRIIS